jgi:hypothetical protein
VPFEGLELLYLILLLRLLMDEIKIVADLVGNAPPSCRRAFGLFGTVALVSLLSQTLLEPSRYLCLSHFLFS